MISSDFVHITFSVLERVPSFRTCIGVLAVFLTLCHPNLLVYLLTFYLLRCLVVCVQSHGLFGSSCLRGSSHSQSLCPLYVICFTETTVDSYGDFAVSFLVPQLCQFSTFTYYVSDFFSLLLHILHVASPSHLSILSLIALV